MAKKPWLHSHVMPLLTVALNKGLHGEHLAVLAAYKDVIAVQHALSTLAGKRKRTDAIVAEIAAQKAAFEPAMLRLRDALNSLMDSLGTSGDDRNTALRSWEAQLESDKARHSGL